MKLTSAQVERTLTQFEGEVIPDNHPVLPQLNSLFGEHTFFLDSHGLNIVEPPEAGGSGCPVGQGDKSRQLERRRSETPGASRTRIDRRCCRRRLQPLNSPSRIGLPNRGDARRAGVRSVAIA